MAPIYEYNLNEAQLNIYIYVEVLRKRAYNSKHSLSCLRKISLFQEFFMRVFHFDNYKICN